MITDRVLIGNCMVSIFKIWYGLFLEYMLILVPVVPYHSNKFIKILEFTFLTFMITLKSMSLIFYYHSSKVPKKIITFYL